LPPYGYSVRSQMLDLAGLLDQADVRRPVVVAVAMSTTIAATYTVEHPQRVRGLVLCSWYELDGFPKMEERRRPKYTTSFAHLHMQMHALVRDGGPQALIDHAERERDRFLPILPTDDAARARVMRMMASHPAEHYIKAAEFYTSMPDLVPALRTVRCPILGICGEDDPCPDRPDLVTGAVDFREVWIPAARRFAMMERPREFGEALEKFLNSLPA
jgi:3-oxoadipate enol-lactonase